MLELQTLVLALVQGITEFLPISSSAHLIIASELFHWRDQGAAFDLALHIGTLFAVLVYFRRDIITLIKDWSISVYTRKPYGQSKLAWCLFVATIPACVVGLLLLPYVDTVLRSTSIIIFTTFFYAFLLFLADRYGTRSKPITAVNLKSALIIGVFQALALIPGTSRSGATITAGLFLGLDREAASRFSFLLAVPITLVAIIGKISSDALQGSEIPWLNFCIGALIACITAFLVIHFFLKLINRFGMMPYVIYRVLLGVALLSLSFFN